MRKVLINKQVIKDIEKFDAREKQWINTVICYLENEENNIELIKQKFKPLGKDLKGYYKAKHRGFKIRFIFKILNDNEIAITIEKGHVDPLIDEIIQLNAVGKRDFIYELASKRVKSKDKD